ncbi:hypothetical protein ACJMK2_017635 [Sinanodonta woodiana]|uniref:Uncharacterized protein n=1 Tax=Sinanodonta woodiana TaxID=1069815 RepID=A0ABD3UAX6_SINWO
MDFDQKLLEKEINELYEREISRFDRKEFASGLVFKKKLKRSFSHSLSSLSNSLNSSLDEVKAMEPTHLRQKLNTNVIDLSNFSESVGDACIFKKRRFDRTVLNCSEDKTNVLNLTLPQSILNIEITGSKDSVINFSLVCPQPDFLSASQNIADKTCQKENEEHGGQKLHPARRLSTEHAVPVLEATHPKREKNIMKISYIAGETTVDEDSTDSYESGITARDRKLSRESLDKSRNKDTCQNLRNRRMSCKQNQRRKSSTNDNKICKSGQVQDSNINSRLQQMLLDDNTEISKNCDVQGKKFSKRKKTFLRKKSANGKSLNKDDATIIDEKIKDSNFACEICSNRRTEGICKKQSCHNQITGKGNCYHISVLSCPESNSSNNKTVIRKKHEYAKIRNLKDSSSDQLSHAAVKSQQIMDKTYVSHINVGGIKSYQSSSQGLNSESENSVGQVSLSVRKPGDKPCTANKAEMDLSHLRETHTTDISGTENFIPTASMRWINIDSTSLRNRQTSLAGLGSLYQRGQLRWDCIVSEFCNF